MKMERKWMILMLLLLGTTIFSGCAANKEMIMAYNEAKGVFEKAKGVGAKECAPCEYALAEANLALAGHGIDKWWLEDEQKIERAIAVVKEKSLQAIKICEKPVTPPKPAEPPKPEPPPPPPPAPPKPAAPPVLDTIYFDPAKTNINPAAAKALDRTGMILKENPQLKVEIGGHTDASGDDKANQKISEKRAQSAKKYLQDKFNIAENRLTVKGYGATKPIADDKTQEGRSKNRRVEFKYIP
ncbi:MAG: hypothetical protein A2157_20160 [Deltaproteobacteria bacterium RBG_16_47_11]|nr:MAG: hypothetical protein A2157_20160 [Deltaproteobacteria bacterium RBG_16_47_11]